MIPIKVGDKLLLGIVTTGLNVVIVPDDPIVIIAPVLVVLVVEEEVDSKN